MPLIESIIASLNPDAGKTHYKFLNNNRDEAYVETIDDSIMHGVIENFKIHSIEEQIYDEVKNISLLSDNWNCAGTSRISSDVLNNTLNIINAIPPSLLYYLNPDNIYPSKYGTIIMDWEFGNKENYLSLEIAKDSIGYFIEVNGKDHKQIEKINTNDDDSFDYAIASINNDLSIFLV